MKFSDYIKINPVLFGIGKDDLFEEQHIDSYHGFIGNKSDIVGQHVGNGIFHTNDGNYIHSDGKKNVKFDNLESAEDFAEKKRTRFKNDIKKLHDSLTTNKKYSQSELKTIRRYTDHLGGINHHLTHGEKLNEKDQLFVDHLDSIIKDHPVSDDTIVYTGTNENHAKVLRMNTEINHPGFLSTSISPNSARSFARQKGGDIVKIHIPKGHPALYVSNLSGYEGEREFVLPRNTKLVLSRSKEQVMIHDDKEYKVHHATIVTEK